MILTSHKEDGSLKVAVEGRVDSTTAAKLEAGIKEVLDGSVKSFDLDFAKVEYLSSAGLRVLLLIAKQMKSQGPFVLRNVNSGIMDVLQVTGFADILTIKNS